VDAGVFLAPVDEGSLAEGTPWCTFATDWTVPHEPQLQTVALRVGTVPRSSPGRTPSFSDRHDLEEGEVLAEEDAVPPPCPDLGLVSPKCAYSRGYTVAVGNPGRGEEDSFFVLSLRYEAAPSRGQQPGEGGAGCPTQFKRVRLQ
jgi:hypothetical protein